MRENDIGYLAGYLKDKKPEDVTETFRQNLAFIAAKSPALAQVALTLLSATQKPEETPQNPEGTPRFITRQTPFGELVYDLDTRIIASPRKPDEPNYLTPREGELLIALMTSESTVKNETLMRNIWHVQGATNDERRTLRTHINRLRTKIGEDLIVIIRRVGYAIPMPPPRPPETLRHLTL